MQRRPALLGRLFWKTWASLGAVLFLTYLVSGSISNQLRLMDEEQAIRERPWRAVEALALEAEQYADAGGDLATWVDLPATRLYGEVFLLDHLGQEITGRQLPARF